MMIIGCDYHPGFEQIAFVDTETGELQERRLEHREEAERFYRDLAAQGVKVRWPSGKQGGQTKKQAGEVTTLHKFLPSNLCREGERAQARCRLGGSEFMAVENWQLSTRASWRSMTCCRLEGVYLIESGERRCRIG